MIQRFLCLFLIGFSHLGFAERLTPELATVCTRLLLAVQAHDVDYGGVRFPNQVEVAMDPESLKRYFHSIREYWKNRPKGFFALLEKAKDQELSAEDLQALKSLRGRLRIVRFGFNLLDKRHQSPETINWIVKTTGALTDAYKNGHHGRANATAKTLLEYFGERNWLEIEEEIHSFKTSSEESFREYLKDQVAKLGKGLESHRMTAEQFHDLRKIVSRLLTFFDILMADLPADDVKAAFRFLSTTQYRMGRIHDHLVKLHLANRFDYHNDRFRMSKDLHERLATIVRKFPKALGLE